MYILPITKGEANPKVPESGEALLAENSNYNRARITCSRTENDKQLYVIHMYMYNVTCSRTKSAQRK